MYIIYFNGPRQSLKFETMNDAAEFLCSVDYGFISCIDISSKYPTDCTLSLCKLISKRLENKHREDKIKEDF